MAKRIFSALLVYMLVLSLRGGQVCAEDQAGHETHILVTSDLHFTLRSESSIYPLMDQIGSLSIGISDLDYQTIPLDFSNASVELFDVLQKEEEQQRDRMAVVDRIDPSDHFSLQEREDAARLFSLFMDHFSEGSLADVQAQILADPGYEALVRVFADTNYGPWMEWTLNQTLLPGNRLHLSWN